MSHLQVQHIGWKNLKSTVAKERSQIQTKHAPAVQDRISATKNRSGCQGLGRERSDHRRAAWGSPSGGRTALNSLTVVVTQPCVLVNFHRLVHQKDQIVKKFFKFLIFWKKCFPVLYNKIGPLSKFILKMHFNRPIGSSETPEKASIKDKNWCALQDTSAKTGHKDFLGTYRRFWEFDNLYYHQSCTGWIVTLQIRVNCTQEF